MLSVRFSKEDEQLIRRHAAETGISVSEFLREAAISKIEDEYDLKIYKEYLENEEYKITRPLDELISELGLENEI